MPSAARTETFGVSMESFYNTVVNYTAYPQFVSNVKKVEILHQEEHYVQARFTAHVLRDFSYILDLHHEPPKLVWWELSSGDLFKQLDGSWVLTRRGKRKTEVTYLLEVATKVKAPKVIVQQFATSGLAAMMKRFAQEAEELDNAAS